MGVVQRRGNESEGILKRRREVAKGEGVREKKGEEDSDWKGRLDND